MASRISAVVRRADLHGLDLLLAEGDHRLEALDLRLLRANLVAQAPAHDVEPPVVELPAPTRDNDRLAARSRGERLAQGRDGGRHVQELGDVAFLHVNRHRCVTSPVIAHENSGSSFR